MITPALAPTATRGVVRLIFDADGQRYAVAREARRSGGKTSRVSMHASRLERLHDPGELDGEGDVLAADSEVTGAVEHLLGLSYDHFIVISYLHKANLLSSCTPRPANSRSSLPACSDISFMTSFSHAPTVSPATDRPGAKRWRRPSLPTSTPPNSR